MNFLELAGSRFSLRNFSPQKVEREKINYLLQAAQLAPSAMNNQPWSFIVVTQADMLERIHDKCYPRDWFKTASMCIVVCGDHQQSWKRPNDGKDHCEIDTAIAIDHMTLAANELGLGTCWICNFNLEKCRQLFNFAPHLEPIAILAVGYPADKTMPDKNRKGLGEITSWIE